MTYETQITGKPENYCLIAI